MKLYTKFKKTAHITKRHIDLVSKIKIIYLSKDSSNKNYFVFLKAIGCFETSSIEKPENRISGENIFSLKSFMNLVSFSFRINSSLIVRKTYVVTSETSNLMPLCNTGINVSFIFW